jgi:hypothetical protein
MKKGMTIRPKSWRGSSADRIIESVAGPYLFTRDVLTGALSTIYPHERELWTVVQ